MQVVTSVSQQAVQIGREIFRQCGTMTLLCLGAHDKTIVDDTKNGRVTVLFKCSGVNIKKGGKVMITYRMGMDDYEVKIGRVRNMEFTPVCELEGVYCDQLESILNQVVG
jgi:hypothetical protein